MRLWTVSAYTEMCMTAALISLEAKRDLFHLLNLLSLHAAAASDTASAVPGKDQHAWARVPPQKQLQRFSPGDAPSWAESPLLQRAPGHLTAAKGLPALLSLPTRDCGGLRWSMLKHFPSDTSYSLLPRLLSPPRSQQRYKYCWLEWRHKRHFNKNRRKM